MAEPNEMFLPHTGWLRFEPNDDVATFLQQGWFEAPEQAFAWLCLRDGDTVLDCGAHIGLFSLIAGRAVGAAGRVISVEPSATTADLLRENTALNDLSNITVVESAVGASTGQAFLHAGGDGRSAYNVIESIQRDGDTAVSLISLEDLLDQHNVIRCDFMKLDVEGAEFDVCNGAPRDLQRLPILMIEFTEPNLRHLGHSTEALYNLLIARGYTMCQFDRAALRLVPAQVSFPIWYDNLFAVRDMHAINHRLASAPAERMRIARDILRRADACNGLREIETFRRQQDELQARITQLEADLQTTSARAHDSATQANLAWNQVKQAEKWLADERATSAKWLALAQQERQRADHTERLLNETRTRLEESQIRLYAFVTSKFETATWKTRIRKKPDWVDAFVATRTLPTPQPK